MDKENKNKRLMPFAAQPVKCRVLNLYVSSCLPIALGMARIPPFPFVLVVSRS